MRKWPWFLVVIVALALLASRGFTQRAAAPAAFFRVELPQGELQLVGTGTYREWKLVSPGFLGFGRVRTGTGPLWLNANAEDPAVAVLVPVDERAGSFVWVGEVKDPAAVRFVVAGGDAAPTQAQGDYFAIPFERAEGAQFSTLQALDASSSVIWSVRTFMGP
ncbi:MAG: hypothetical protein ACYC5Y_13430 [Symbiobacteriia bacterium]